MKTLHRKQKADNVPSETMHAILKWHAYILTISALLAYYFSVHSYSSTSTYSAHHPNYGLQNLGLLFIFLEAAFAYSMNTLQKSVYWLPWLRLRKVTLDERQLAVRQQVYEQAFVITIIALFTLIPVTFKALAHYSDPAQSDLFSKFAIIMGILLISLPASLAAWHKNS